MTTSGSAMSGVPDETTLCVLSNVAWCDAVCRSHGLTPQLGRDMWIQRRQGPPYYSNGITVSRFAEENQYAAIEELKAKLPDGFSIKDSFARLDLAKAGFSSLFAAEWVWLDAEALPSGSDWTRVETEADLVRWESAWAANGSPTSTRVFLPQLLSENNIAFFGVERDGEVIAGCAANRSQGDVVGFSNFFAPAEEINRFQAAAVKTLAAFAPGRPIVGYERDYELAALLTLGFRSVGVLRVWVWP
jgi:hypothetical protein